MTDPFTITASAIATLAFQKMVEGVGSETGKKFSEKAFGLIDQLRQKIVARFKGQEKVQPILDQAQTGDSAAIQNLAKFIDLEMFDEKFKGELSQLAEQINQYIIEDNSTQVQINHGGTNFQNKVTGGKVFQAETININETT